MVRKRPGFDFVLYGCRMDCFRNIHREPDNLAFLVLWGRWDSLRAGSSPCHLACPRIGPLTSILPSPAFVLLVRPPRILHARAVGRRRRGYETILCWCSGNRFLSFLGAPRSSSTRPKAIQTSQCLFLWGASWANRASRCYSAHRGGRPLRLLGHSQSERTTPLGPTKRQS